MEIKYQGCLLSVKDMEASKRFYQEVLGQKLIMDIGAHVSFEGFSLQQGYLSKNEFVAFTFENDLYRAHIMNVSVFPQCYAAIAGMLPSFGKKAWSPLIMTHLKH